MIPIRPRPPLPGEVAVVFAEHQSEYIPLPAVINLASGLVTTEWEFTAEELAAIVAGGRLRLVVWTFGNPLQPVQLEIVP